MEKAVDASQLKENKDENKAVEMEPTKEMKRQEMWKMRKIENVHQSALNKAVVKQTTRQNGVQCHFLQSSTPCHKTNSTHNTKVRPSTQTHHRS
jgi:hypothetical protein